MIPALLGDSVGSLVSACLHSNPVSASSRAVALSKASTFLDPSVPQFLGGGVCRALGVVPSVDQGSVLLAGEL